MIDIVARSFAVLPISSTPMHAEGWLVLARAGTLVFSAGLLLALPIVAALLITNIALGVLTRAAPQMNLFAIGFPITSTIGFVVLLLTLDVLAPTMQRFFEQGFDLMGITVRAWGV